MPTIAEKPTDATIHCGGIAVGQCVSAPTASVPMPPATTPINAADRREHDRFGKELPQNRRGARADRHAQADLARALGDRDEHDVHDADAADDQRNGRDAGEQQLHDRAGLRSGLRDRLQVAHLKVVGLRRNDAMALLEQLRDALR